MNFFRGTIVFILFMALSLFWGCGGSSSRDDAQSSIGYSGTSPVELGKEMDEFSRYIPEDALVYFSIEDVPDFINKLKETSFYKEVFGDEVFQKHIKDIFEDTNFNILSDSDMTIPDFINLFSGQAACASLDFDTNTGMPKIVVLLDIKNNIQSWRKFIEEHPDILAQKYEPKMEKLVYRIHEDVLILSLHEQVINKVIKLRKDNEKNLSNNPEYMESRRGIPSDSVVTTFVDYKTIDKKRKHPLLGESGGESAGPFSNLSGNVYSTIYSGLNLDSSGCLGFARLVLGDAVEGNIIGPGDHSEALKFCPTDTSVFMSVNIDIATMYYNFMEIVTDFDEDTDKYIEELNDKFGFDLEKDFVDPLGSGFFINLGQFTDVSSISNILIGLEVKNEQRLSGALRKLIDDNFGNVRESDYRDTKIYTITIQGAPVSVFYAFSNGFLIFSGNQIALQMALDRAASGDNLSGSDELNDTIARLDSDNHMLLFLQNKYLMSGLLPMINSFTSSGDSGSTDSSLMYILEKLFRGSVGATVTWLDDSIVVKTYNSYGVPANMYAAAPLLAAIGVPNFLQAQTRAKVARTKADIRTLTTAMEAYNIDYNKFPENLYLLTTPIDFIIEVPDDPFTNGEKIKLIIINEQEWLLYGVGPDETDDMGAFAYDPTNGTNSRGDIKRSRKD